MSGMPSITITFTELAASAVQRGERGIIAMILKEATPPTPAYFTVASVADIPNTISSANKKQIELALTGYVNAPKRVLVYVIPATVIPSGETDPVDNTDYTDALNYFKTVKWNYLVVPTVATDSQTTAIVNYIKAERAANVLVKAVLPNTIADHEGIINYTATGAIEGDTTYTAEEYCSRIAGIIAGTPLTMSATYATLPELTDCSRMTKAEMDAAVAAGKFFIWWDGEKVKTARAVNSLTTLTSEKNSQFQKIKVVDAMDMMSDDIRKTVQDNYIGKYANSYDNKQLLVAAIGSYFEGLVMDQVLSAYNVEIDVDANRQYLAGRGVDVSALSEEEIKRANTGSNVYLKAEVTILDAIEDVTLKITI